MSKITTASWNDFTSDFAYDTLEVRAVGNHEIHVQAGKVYDVSNLLGLTVTGYTEMLDEPGDFYIQDNRVKFDADDWNELDNVNNGVEIRYMNKAGQIVSELWDFIIDEPGTGIGKTLSGNAKANVINGSSFEDTIDGKGGNDRINGRGGDDFLFGGKGNDTLTGGPGDDTFTGGPGKDVFKPGDGFDTITDYGHGDKIIWEGATLTKNLMQHVAVRDDGGTLLDNDGSGGISDGDIYLQDVFL